MLPQGESATPTQEGENREWLGRRWFQGKSANCRKLEPEYKWPLGTGDCHLEEMGTVSPPGGLHG